MVADTYHNNPFMRRRLDAERKKQREEKGLKWACNCDSYRFILREGGGIECTECGAAQDLRHFDPRVPAQK